MLLKKNKQKILRGCKGAISILLCILLTPFLSTAAILIEYSRYQSAAETLQELIDLSTFSTLAEYDSYVQDRFGLFSISQECKIEEEYSANLANNIGLLGKGLTIADNSKVTGSYPLSNMDVLKSQVLDFSESTVLTDFLLKDLNIEDLLKKLDNLKGLSSLANAASNVADLAESVEQLVEAGNAFVTSLQTAYNSAAAIKNNAQAVINKIADLYKKLSENGIVINTSTDFNDLVKTYAEDFKDIYNSAKTLTDSVSGFINIIGKLPSDYENFKKAFDKSKSTLDKAKNSSSSASDASKDTSTPEAASTLSQTANATTQVFDMIIDQLKDAVADASVTLKESTVNSMKTAATDFVNDLKSRFKWDLYTNANGYFSLPLTDEAKSDVKKILEKVPAVWKTNSYDELLNTLKSIYLPENLDLSSFSNALNSITGMVSDAMSIAEKKFKAETEGHVSNILKTLVSTVRNMFKMDVFYNGDLNAYLSDDCMATLLQESMSNPFATLLSAIESLLTACTDFVNGLATFNFIKVIKAIVKLLKAVVDTIRSIVQLTQKIITKISEVAGYITSGQLGKFYELLLMSSYVTHDLPNRTNAGNTSVDFSFDNGVVWSTQLMGKSLTNFPYQNIVVPPRQGGTGFSGLDGLTTFLANAHNGGSERMFRGAELEYIVAGTKSEIMNQTITFLDIYLLRFLMDVVVVFTDPGVATMATAATIAAWAVYLLVMIGEPLCDAILLVNNEESYLVKKSCYLTPAGIPKLIGKLADIAIKNPSINGAAKDALTSSISGKLDGLKGSNTFNSGGYFPMSYDTHMLLVLFVTTSENDLLTRLANIIQLESNMYYSKKGAGFNFDIKKTYTSITTETTIQYNSFLSIFEFNDTSVFTKTYKKSRSY